MAITAGANASGQAPSEGGGIIAVRGISKLYPRPSGGRTPVLRNIDLAITPGTILGLLGPNGAGKTTLIKILAGLLRPDSGGGTVLGYDLLRQHADIRARVSLVAPTADVGIDNNLTVRQNLTFWAPIYGLRGAQARARIDALLEQLDLVAKADAWPMHISAGQRQRLALARSLLAENRLVFLDEPTNKLDLEGVRSVRQMIAELNREQGVTIVLTTHMMEEAEELCGEIALLRQGELVAHQPTEELTRSLHVARPITVTVRRLEAPSAQLAELPALAWEGELRRLPGASGAAPTVASGDLVTLTVESLDLHATTPALLSWVRTQGLTLVSMRAEPVTLTDVFMALTSRKQGEPSEQGGTPGL
ncbi:MAG TPA: ABC transporter ATP-binding protein [Ktedonobacterales bacterium]|jgi:ABC-2 type transport system ATP-binding protein|nr:ABC transporter ATP-binding protein [Ktedonobacterales bacterium]